MHYITFARLCKWLTSFEISQTKYTLFYFLLFFHLTDVLFFGILMSAETKNPLSRCGAIANKEKTVDNCFLRRESHKARRVTIASAMQLRDNYATVRKARVKR